MDKNLCIKCKDELTGKENITCDGCGEMVHEKCSSMASSELRAIVIKNRTLFYFCSTCKNAFKQIPTIIRNLNELIDINKTLKEENSILRQKLSEQKASNNELNNYEIVQEIQERQNRASNIIIYNINESGTKNKQEQVREDTDTITNILDNISKDVTVKKTFRLGKFSVDKNRPIKVILSNPEQAMIILKNKNKLAIPGIYIYNDQTKMQRNYYLSIKEKLKERTERGETDIRIKYVNNIPTIIKDDKNNSQKN